jgi:hypothetical protein
MSGELELRQWVAGQDSVFIRLVCSGIVIFVGGGRSVDAFANGTVHMLGCIGEFLV